MWYLLYSRTSECWQVNRARKQMFAKRKQLEHIPPTQTALLEHTKRTIYQGSHVWGETLVPLQNLPSPGEWGWQQDDNNNWVPHWTNIPEASMSCKELIKCGCKKACRRPCKCTIASLPCTELCACAGSCYTQNDDN